MNHYYEPGFWQDYCQYYVDQNKEIPDWVLDNFELSIIEDQS